MPKESFKASVSANLVITESQFQSCQPGAIIHIENSYTFKYLGNSRISEEYLHGSDIHLNVMVNAELNMFLQ